MDVRGSTRVADIKLRDRSIELAAECHGSEILTFTFDHVVLATGHDWPKTTESSPGYFLSPWPASDLASIGDCPVGILGTSLSGIDAVVSLATAHGTFLLDQNDDLHYHVAMGQERFSLTMMSRKGLLPEADFYCSYPYGRSSSALRKRLTI